MSIIDTIEALKYGFNLIEKVISTPYSLKVEVTLKNIEKYRDVHFTEYLKICIDIIYVGCIIKANE